MTNAFEEHAKPLRAKYDAYIADHPKTRIRAVASALGVTELELVAAGCGGIDSVMLTQPAQAIFKQLGTLGVVRAITRNDWAVHERNGRYEEIRAGKTMGVVVGPDIDLRMFFNDWKYTFAVNDNGRQSIQFFDRGGLAVHKVFCIDETDMTAYGELVKNHVQADPQWPVVDTIEPEVYGDTVDQPEALRDQWRGMKDTHSFFGILKKFNVSRLGALGAAGPDLAQKVPNSVVESMLGAVVDRAIPFMCFVGNRGLIQIHSGPITKLLRTGPWFNVLDAHFNLHLDTTVIDSTWVVTKPTQDGWVTSIECYTREGEMIAQFFGARKPRIPELASWRELAAGYCPLPLAA